MADKKQQSAAMRSFSAIAFILGLIGCLSAAAFGQTDVTAQNEVKKAAVKEAKPVAPPPVFTAYKGVVLGMAADEVREKINKKPKIEDKDGFYYVFSDNEAMQVVLDENQKVKVISLIYSGENSGAPTYEAVFGKDVPFEKMPDGRVYKLIRYPESGFWVAYSRSAGENPTVTVTIQKLWDAQ